MHLIYRIIKELLLKKEKTKREENNRNYNNNNNHLSNYINNNSGNKNTNNKNTSHQNNKSASISINENYILIFYIFSYKISPARFLIFSHSEFIFSLISSFCGLCAN